MWTNADSIISEYETELKKMKVVTDFEKRSYEKEGKFTKEKLEIFRRLAKNYLDTEYKKVLEIEEGLKSGIQGLVNRYLTFSVLFPPTFYNAVQTEMSSCGYINLLKFYQYCIDKHEGFVKFWVERVFYHDPHDMKSFIQGDENLYRAGTRLPGNYLTGVLVSLVWVLLLYYLSYVRFKGLLVEISADKHKPVKEKDRELTVKKGEINVFYTLRPIFRDQLYLKFSGQSSGLKEPLESGHLKLTMDKKEIKGDRAAEGFIYFIHPQDIPGDIRGVDLVDYVLVSNNYAKKERAAIISKFDPGLLQKTFEQMEGDEKFDVLVPLLPLLKGSIFLLYHTCKDLPLEYHIKLKKQFEILESRGCTVIYLSHEKDMPDTIKEPDRDIIELEHWMNEMQTRERMSTGTEADE
jgi:hypothetical protein